MVGGFRETLGEGLGEELLTEVKVGEFSPSHSYQDIRINFLAIPEGIA